MNGGTSKKTITRCGQAVGKAFDAAAESWPDETESEPRRLPVHPDEAGSHKHRK